MLIPPLDPQHRNNIGKYGTKLRSNPQQSRNKAATEGQRSDDNLLAGLMARG